MILEELLAARKRAKKASKPRWQAVSMTVIIYIYRYGTHTYIYISISNSWRREAMAEADDPLTKSVLNGRQSLSQCRWDCGLDAPRLALKVSANSVYGFTGTL